MDLAARNFYQGVLDSNSSEDGINRDEVLRRLATAITYISSAGRISLLYPLGYAVGDVHNVMASPYNATGDGSSDDTTAIQAAIDGARSAGGGIVFFPEGRYKYTSHLYGFGGLRFLGMGRKSILVGSGTTGGSDRQLSIETGLPDITNVYNSEYPDGASVFHATATGALAVGQFSLTLTVDGGFTIANLSVGDRVYLWLGQDATDLTLPYRACFNVVKTIAGSIVTFCDPIPEAIGALSGGRTHHVWKPSDVAENIEIGHLAFERDLDSGNQGYNAVGIIFARNAWVHDLFFKNMGYASVVTTYSENVVLERIYTDRSVYDGAFSASSGGWLSGWTNNGLVIRDCVGQDIGSGPITFEGQNRRIVIENVRITSSEAAPPFNYFISFPSGSTTKGYIVRNVEMQALAVWNGIVGAEPDVLENITCWNKVNVASLRNLHGALRYEGVLVSRRKTFSKTFRIQASVTSQNVLQLSGWFAAIRIYMSTVTGVTSLTLIANATVGGELISQLISGAMVELTAADSGVGLCGIEPLGSGSFNNNPTGDYRKDLTLTTNGSVPDNAYGRIEIDYFPLGAGAGVDDLSKARIDNDTVSAP